MEFVNIVHFAQAITQPKIAKEFIFSTRIETVDNEARKHNNV